MAEINLPRPGDFLLGIEQHLLPLCNSARGSRNRKQHREHRYRETHRLVNEAGVKVHVGIDTPLHEVFVFECYAFAFERNVNQQIAPHYVENLVGNPLHKPGARIVVLLNAVAEAHEQLFTYLDALDVVRHVIRRADLNQHP